jgi:hypothetical protein
MIITASANPILQKLRNSCSVDAGRSERTTGSHSNRTALDTCYIQRTALSRNPSSSAFATTPSSQLQDGKRGKPISSADRLGFFPAKGLAGRKRHLRRFRIRQVRLYPLEEKAIVRRTDLKADERPVRFRLDGREYIVEEVLNQWYGPQDVFYKVRADNGNLYILRQQTSAPDRSWDLVSFRRLLEDR